MAKDITFDIIAKDRASKVFSSVGSASQDLGGKLGHVGSVAALALGTTAVTAVLALGAAMVNGVKDAADYQQLGDKTAAVLKSTGNAAHQSVAGIQARAAALESMSGVDETLIINGQNVLATFTQVKDGIGAGNDIFNQATTAALNMSTALGQDMQSSTVQLGKALNDPIKGITALSRVGVSFTAQQKDQIAAMVKSGDTMGAQKVILGELSKEFGGAAEAAGKGFSGSLARVKDFLSDTMRDIGTKLLPVLTNLSNWFLDTAVPAIQDFMKSLAPLSGVFDNISYAFGVFVDALQGYETDADPWVKPIMEAGFTIRDVFTQVVAFFQGQLFPAISTLAKQILPPLTAAFVTVATFIRANVLPVVMALAEFFVQHVIPAVGKLVVAIAGGLKSAFQTIQKTISEHRTELATLGNALKVVGSFIMDKLVPILAVVLKAAFVVVGATISAAIVLIAGIVQGFQTLGSWGTWLWEKAIKPAFTAILNAFSAVAGAVGTMLEALSNVPGFGWAKDAADALQTAAQNAHDLAAGINAVPDTKHVTITFDSSGFSTIPGVISAAAANAGRNAGGTDNWRGGLTWVGEQGPELLDLPGGSKIHSNADSKVMAASGTAAGRSGPMVQIEHYHEGGNSPDMVAAELMFRFRGST